MSDEAGEKKHDPGEKKWRDAAEKGQLPRSNDVAAVAVVFVGAAALTFGSGPAADAIRDLSVAMFYADGPYVLNVAVARDLGARSIATTLRALVVPLSMVMLASLIANLAQTQMRLATKALEPKWDKLNVINGLKSTYFSWTPLVELGKGLGKIGALTAAVAAMMWRRLENLPMVATLPPAAQLEQVVDLGWNLILAALPIMLILAAADYFYALYKTTEDLKRTDKELRDDLKEQEGDPMLKAKRRQRAIQIARSVNLALIAQADVVVTNPTHYAVALRYHRDTDAAPIVLVKGVDALALTIRKRAREASVATVENRALARALYAKAEMGHAIPEDLYKPVAKVLAAVMKRRKKKPLISAPSSGARRGRT